MALGGLVSVFAAPARAGQGRAFAGLTGPMVATLLVLCLCWSLERSIASIPTAWRDHWLGLWLATLGSDVVCHATIAAVMGLPIIVVGNLGPASGWRRVAALATTIALTAPLAAVIRYAYVKAVYVGVESFIWNATVFLKLYGRYVQPAALLTLVLELHRRETLSVAAMHRAEVDRLALEREMDQARLQVLQAQIEPHFLFNTLANVRRLYRTRLVAGREMLEHLMRYLEVALPRMRDERSTLDREIALVESYLEVQRIRMGRRLDFEIDIAAGLRDVDVPPMMILTLVENAIKHGLNPLPQGGSIAVRARREAGRLCIDVSDSGCGLHASAGVGTGLANIRARLAVMHGEAASLVIAENAPRAITATLELPVTAAMR